MIRTRTSRAIAGALLLTALWLDPASLEAHEPDAAPKSAQPKSAQQKSAPPKVEAQHVATKPLDGDPDKEIDIQIYTFPPGSTVPWHIHKDAVEIAYGLQGSVMLETKDKPPYTVAEGQTNIFPANVVHRGWNPSKTDEAKLYVVRIKPKGTPLATIVPPPAKTPGAKTPGAAVQDYPEDASPGDEDGD